MVNKILLGLFLSLRLSQLQAAEGESRKRPHSSSESESEESRETREIKKRRIASPKASNLNSEKKEKCLICLGTEEEAGKFAPQNELNRLLTCKADKHSNMHLACLTRWLATNTRCPACRAAAIHTQNNYENTPLHIAVSQGNLASVNELLATGADVNARDISGETPLNTAITMGHLAIAQALIEAGTELNIGDTIGQSPLHNTVIWSRLAIAQALIIAGANVNAQNAVGQTPLHYAVRRNRLEIVQTLLAAPGINVNIRNTNGQLAIDLAHTDEIRDLLRSSAASQ